MIQFDLSFLFIFLCGHFFGMNIALIKAQEKMKKEVPPNMARRTLHAGSQRIEGMGLNLLSEDELLRYSSCYHGCVMEHRCKRLKVMKPCILWKTMVAW